MRRLEIFAWAAALVLLSAPVLASPISDPGGIIRSGEDYASFINIGPGFTLTVGGEPLGFPFNPYDTMNSSFCPTETGFMPGLGSVTGPDCLFINESGRTIGSISELFS